MLALTLDHIVDTAFRAGLQPIECVVCSVIAWPPTIWCPNGHMNLCLKCRAHLGTQSSCPSCRAPFLAKPIPCIALRNLTFQLRCVCEGSSSSSASSISALSAESKNCMWKWTGGISEFDAAFQQHLPYCCNRRECKGCDAPFIDDHSKVKHESACEIARLRQQSDPHNGYAKFRFAWHLDRKGDRKQALVWYEKSALLDVHDAQWIVAKSYKHGEGAEVDYVKAARWFARSVASKGQYSAQARCELGLCYENGHGVVQDNDMAFSLYGMSANDGNVDAQNNVGYCFDRGIGVTRNEEKALHWLSIAADAGNAAAQLTMGQYYAEGKAGVQVDPKKAFQYVEASANQGHVPAYLPLAKCYMLSFGVYRRAKCDVCKYGIGDPMRVLRKQNLSKCVECNFHLDEKSLDEQAFALLQKSVNSAANNWNNWHAALLLGDAYAHGIGVVQNAEIAFTYFTMAIIHSFVCHCQIPMSRDAHHSTYLLGGCFENGFGTARDSARALDYYARGAKEGSANCASAAGLCEILTNGKVDANKEQDASRITSAMKRARNWFRESADFESPCPVGTCNYGLCLLFGVGGEKDEELAAEYLKQGVSYGDAVSGLALAMCYQLGRGVKRNLHLAKLYVEEYQSRAFCIGMKNFVVADVFDHCFWRRLSNPKHGFDDECDGNCAFVFESMCTALARFLCGSALTLIEYYLYTDRAFYHKIRSNGASEKWLPPKVNVRTIF